MPSFRHSPPGRIIPVRISRINRRVENHEYLSLLPGVFAPGFFLPSCPFFA
jgi:hypothetical protein